VLRSSTADCCSSRHHRVDAHVSFFSIPHSTTFYPFDLNFTLDERVGSVVITTNSCLFELELARLVCSPSPARRVWSSQRRAESTPRRVGARHDPGVRDGARGERVMARACAGTTARPGLCLFLFITLCNNRYIYVYIYIYVYVCVCE